MALILSVLFTAFGGLLVSLGSAPLRYVGVVLFCGALLAIAELCCAVVIGRREERCYRTYDGP